MKHYVVLFTLLLISCLETESPRIDYDFKYGRSFGFCIGLCYSEIHFQDGEVILNKESREGDSSRTFTRKINDQEFNSLFKKFNPHKFNELPSIIGCPDCADGGAEYIEVLIDGEWKRVTFEYGSAVEGIQVVVNNLRDLYDSLDE
jgi:hypothetical protein